jgi:hypothetical protein
MLMNIPRTIIKLPVLINCRYRYSQGQGRDSTGRDSRGRDSQGRYAHSRQGHATQGQSRQGQSRQGQSHKTNGLAPLSFDLSFDSSVSFDLSLSLRVFVDWIAYRMHSFLVSYASVWVSVMDSRARVRVRFMVMINVAVRIRLG